MVKKKNQDPLFVTSMFLHKKGTTLATIISPEFRRDIDHEVTLKSYKHGSGKMFVFNPGGNPPSWQKYVKKIDPTLNLASSVNNSVVMTLYVSGRLVSLTFGYGNSKLNTETLVSDFGRKASINLVNPDFIREVSDVTISETTFQTQKHNTGIRNSKSIFSKDPAAFVKGLSGHSYVDWNYPFTCDANFSSVGSSLKIKANIQIDKNLKSMLMYILQIYDKPLSPQLSFLNKINPITDDYLNSLLWDSLFNKLVNGMINNFSISFPSDLGVDIVSERIPDVKYNLKTVIPGELASKFVDEIQNNHLNVKWISDKIMKSQLIVQDEYDNEYRAQLKKSIITELVYNSVSYVLLFNTWYSVDTNFLHDLDKELDSILENSNLYPNHNSTNEKDYFPNLGSTLGWANIDLKTYSPKDGTMDRVEVADFVSKNHEFTHVKYGHSSSSKLSHLFLQGNNSGVLMSSRFGEQGFIDKINDLLKQHNFPTMKLGDKDIKIRFLIMKSDKKRKDIPLFSKISLMTVKKNLESLGFTVSYVLVDQ
ncbi:MAG: TIGR04141 family sporadically distributed protein [Lactobacillaceae bacterium]